MSIKKFYGKTGHVIINTDEGDVVIVIDIDLMEVLRVGDKICLCSYDEIKPDKHRLIKAKWLVRIENHCNMVLDNSNNKLKLYDVFAEVAITIIDKWYNEHTCTCFASVSNDTKQQLCAFLTQYKNTEINKLIEKIL